MKKIRARCFLPFFHTSTTGDMLLDDGVDPELLDHRSVDVQRRVHGHAAVLRTISGASWDPCKGGLGTIEAREVETSLPRCTSAYCPGAQ